MDRGATARHASNPWLDLVRAIAIGLVLLRHGERAVAPHGDGFLHNLAVNGWVGVDLFLALSGYLITRHLIGAGLESERFSFARYLSLRALRIVPAYLAMIALVLVGAFPLYRADASNLVASVGWHLLFLQDYLPANINVVLWSLGVEAKFYVGAPFLLAAVIASPSSRHAFGLLAAIAIMAPLARAATWANLPAPIDYETFFTALRSPCHASLEPLIAGVAVGVAQHRGFVKPDLRRGYTLLGAASGVLALWLVSHEFLASITIYDATLQPTLIAAVAGLMLLGGVHLRGAPMPLTPPIRTAADLAYCLYLVHFPLIPMALTLSSKASTPAMAFWAIYLPVSVLVALLLHHLVERRCLLLKGSIERRSATVEPTSVRAAI